ncbi:RNA polymerase sigma factor [Mycetocola spongiae]|uniref:RNA polymerase sigma factor n=1 Tax=Mycetocola spongiae TaxID=2859226 RepID=UPI001CF5807A|nr:sigma-70 family RNA polymerase sigma factor [Mycetocola spongiae]UCR90330.1 sigma-70 family RNA polymerase sigma factor [Mycetocola spongiae]
MKKKTSSVEFTGQFIEDQEMLARHRSGAPEAFSEIYQRYEAAAFSIALRYTSSQTEAQDIVLESFTRILEAIRRGKGPTVSFSHYLRSTVRSTALRLLDKKSLESTHAPEELTVLAEEIWRRDAVDYASELPDGAEWLAVSFNALEELEQRVLWLRVVEGIPSVEISKQLSITPVRATRIYQRSILKLRRAFVYDAVHKSEDPECLLNRDRLLTLITKPDTPLTRHICECPTCSVVVKRLGVSERTLLAGVVVAGLVGSGFTFAPPAAVAAVPVFGGILATFLSLRLPTKIAIASVPIAVAAGGIWIALSTLPDETVATSHAQVEVILGQPVPGAGNTEKLISVGSCDITREATGEERELWRVNESGGRCIARISKPHSGELLIDTAEAPHIRTVEIAIAGLYSVTLSDGEEQRSAEISVSPEHPYHIEHSRAS